MSFFLSGAPLILVPYAVNASSVDAQVNVSGKANGLFHRFENPRFDVNAWVQLAKNDKDKEDKDNNKKDREDHTAAVIADIKIDPTATNTNVSWTTNEETRGYVLVGTGAEVGDRGARAPSAKLEMRHQATVRGLSAETNYYLVIVATDRNGNTTRSAVQSFRTLVAPPDVKAPVVSRIKAVTTDTSTTITWHTSENANASVRYATVRPLTTDSAIVSSATFTMDHKVVLTNLRADTKYFFEIKAEDGKGNVQTSQVQTFHTKRAPDTVSPTIVFQGSFNVTATSAQLFWVTSEKTDGRVWLQTSYPVDTNLVPTKTVASFSHFHGTELNNLTPNTLYYYVITSTDASGNSVTVSVNSFTTAAQ